MQVTGNPLAPMKDRMMQIALAYVISLGIVGFGAWIGIAGLSSSAPAVWICLALFPIAVGLLSISGER